MTTSNGQTYTYTIDSRDNLTKVTFPGGASREYVYENENFFNAITGVIDRASPGDIGSRYGTITYDASGRATASYLAPNIASGAIGRNSFVYNSNNTIVTDPLGLQRTLTFSTMNGVRNIASITQPCASCGGGDVKSTTYDVAGYVDLTTDFNGGVTDHDYDTRGLETKRIEASNTSGATSPKRTLETQWHADFRVPVSRTTKNASGTLEAKTTWAYNTRGQATARCELDPADPAAMSYACSATSAPPVAAKVRRTVTTYCEPADVTAGTCPLVGLVTAVNGPRPAGDAGMAAGQDDRTAYTYYASDDASCASNGACPHRRGDLWKVTNALGQVTTYVSYDKNGRVTRTQDANGTVTDFVYHVRGWLTDRIVRASAAGTPGAGDAATHIDYDAVGNVKKVIQPDGAFLAYTYDDAHRLIKIADNQNNTIDYCPGGAGSAQCLDAAGNRRVEQVKDPSGTLKRSLSRSYNSLSQLVRLNNAAGAAVEQSQGLSDTGVADGYDGNGNRVRVQDGLGIGTKQRYDGLNRLVETLQNYNGTDAATANASTGYVYDTRDNLRQVTDPDGLNTVYDYDGLNNLTGLHSPDTGDSSYGYDLAGNRRTQTDARGVTSTYAYDALNRLTAIGYPTATLNVGYAYDQSNAVTGCAASSPLGRLTTMTDASGSTTYCYDRRGNVTRKKQVIGSTTLTTDYAYSVADRLASITYPSGAIVAYARDALGRVTAVTWKANAGAAATTVVSNASYYPFGPLNVLTYGNGRTLSKLYDQDYAIDAVLSSGTGGLALNLDVDVMGNIVSAVKPGDLSRGPTPIPTQYAYDPLYRLKDVQQALTSGTLESYTYNKTGDRLSAQLDAGPVTAYAYAAGSHRLASVGGVARTYDANGNTQTGTAPGQSLAYDARNRLTTATQGSQVATYVHNGRGERVSKLVSSGGLGSPPTLYSYDEGGHLLSEYGGTSLPQAEYVYLDGTPIAVIKSGSLAYIETDHLGTPRIVADPATNAARWAWSFFGDTFGADAPDPSPGGAAAYVLNLRFPGQYYDAETSLHYNYLREYESSIGRYVESDPIGLDGGVATYGYAKQSPVVYFDQDGDTPAVGAALCFVPGVGWVSCAAAAVGTVTVGLICYATGACQSMMHGILDMCLGDGGGGGDDRCDKKLSDQLLNKLGIDGHTLKAEALGTNKNLSRFDLCGCNDGRIVVKRYGCKGNDEPQPTGWNWK
jgi:RHS repeat-associated protein